MRINTLFQSDVMPQLKQLGQYAYGALVFAMAIGGFWLAFTLTGVETLADLRPRLHAAIGSLGVFFGQDGTPLPVTTFSAPGMVTTLDEIEVMSPVSARVLEVAVKEGQEIQAGAVIAKLDDSAARRAIATAQAELTAAKNALVDGEKVVVPPQPTPPQAAPATPKDTSKEEAVIVLALDQGYTSVADTLINMPWISDGIGDILYGDEVSSSGAQENMYAYADMVKQSFPEVTRYREAAATSYGESRLAYTHARTSYEKAQRNSPPQTLEALMNETYTMLQKNADALKKTNEFLVYVREGLQNQQREIPTPLPEAISGVTDRIQTVNDNIDAMRNALTALREAHTTLAEAQVVEDPQEIAIIETPTPVDTTSLQSRVSEAERALSLARAELTKYTVLSPAAGKVGKVDARRGKAVVNGEILVLLVSSDTIARVSLSESQVGNVVIGQEARVTFDGVEGLEINGKVLKVDSRATVAEGAVIFYAYIGFTGDSSRARSGMTVTGHFKANTIRE